MTQFTKYSRYGNGYVTNTWVRKILAARLKLALDAQFGLESSPAVKRMAGMEVPVIIESKHRAKQVREDAVAPKANDIRVGLPQFFPSGRIDMGPEVAACRGPAEHTDETSLETPTAVALTKSVDMLTAPAVCRDSSVSIMPAKEEHSGHVTFYQPKGLNQWLREFHDSSSRSYPNIVLDAISWAWSDDLPSRIFALEDCTVRADDLFGRAPALLRKAKSPGKRSTRPVCFHKNDMQVIMRLAREWTGDNRNMFFIGVLAAYQDHQIRSSVATND
ncbi:hypothetical protein ACFFON_12950 [Arthrobacter citreus]|uniref:hypothetical protein n=1 Tax=Arthrobacter TaxID=1663 RepID=UPI001264E968|nr:hypothetical protein [Arthrobacter gandavensis]